MRSALSDALRAEQRSREAEMTPGQRIALALALGRRDLEIFADANGLTLAQAHRELRRSKQVGRRHSGVMEDP